MFGYIKLFGFNKTMITFPSSLGGGGGGQQKKF